MKLLKLIIIICLSNYLMVTTGSYQVQKGIDTITSFDNREYLLFIEWLKAHRNSIKLDQHNEINEPLNNQMIGHLFNYQYFNNPVNQNSFHNSPNPSLFHQARSFLDPFYGSFHGFLFTCKDLKPGFYADIYNNCRYFHLCHQPNLKFNPFNQLAITTYACPKSTYFNQKKIACTSLEEFEMKCVDQYNLFKSNNINVLKDITNNEINFNNSKNKKSDTKIKEMSDKKTSAKQALDEKDNDSIDKLIEEKPIEKDSVGDKREINELISKNIDKVESFNNLTELMTDYEPNTGKNINDNKDEIETEIIETTFNCDRRPHGYYVDVYNKCRIFHICQPHADLNDIHNTKFFMNSFKCPFNLVFNQVRLTCTEEKDLVVQCSMQELFFPKLNSVNKLDQLESGKLNNDIDEIETPSPLK